MRSVNFTQSLIEARDVALAGGKAVNLGRLIRAGFPVPGGFVVTTRAHQMQMAAAAVPFIAEEERVGERPVLAISEEMAEEICTAYRAMGGGSVAVRSSATAEDMGNASMAGQYETFLDIEGEEKLIEAVGHCWASLDSPRIRAYFREHGIDAARVSMAVVVQRLVSADVAGVLFTANPNDGVSGGGRREMLLEASWGLGETVVSGKVQPDVVRVEFESGKVVSAVIADKQVTLVAGHGGAEEAVEEGRRKMACLRGRDVHHLWQMGRRAEEHFGVAQDIEWAIAEGELYLLQSRPITTREDAEAYEEVMRSAREQLQRDVSAGRGPWALHNLAETLPHATPLTWSVIKRFMSGTGGYGEMYRMAGFEPSEMVCREGFLERIVGRVYMDAARAAEMFFEEFPFAYDLNELRESPDVSQTPPTLPKKTGVSPSQAQRRLAGVNEKLHAVSKEFDAELRDQLFPAIAEYVREAKKLPLGRMTNEELVEVWQEREKQVMDGYGPKLLLPSLISGMALEELRAFLDESFWEEETDALAQLISSGGLTNRTLLADAELYEVAKGESRTMEQWLAEHGHRAAGEFDLAAPRWRERAEAAKEMATLMGTGDGPMERHRRHGEVVNAKLAELRGKLNGADCRAFDERVDLVRRYVSFREDGKDFLMLGYDLLRDVALEAGKRLELGEEVFFLSREEMFDALRVGFGPHAVVEKRKLLHRAEGRVAMGRVISAGDVETLGEPKKAESQAGPQHKGVGHGAFVISNGSGMVAGPVRILRSPTEAGDGSSLGKGYILVCPSTDPSWTPLFVNAAGLILECGGTLSHGAVVAREMGLPAVVLADATRMLREGEEICIDTRRAWVGTRAEAQAHEQAHESVEEDGAVVSRQMIPPPVGRQERRAWKARNVAAAIWGVYLLGFFLLPAAWVYWPTLRVLDAVLWPLARAGRPLVVTVVAAVLAVGTLLLQKFMTDNARLLEAKKRANALRKRAEGTKDAAARVRLLALASPVQMRTLMAALVPVGILLGPMVMPFVWFKERVDPAVVIAPAGSTAEIEATVNADWKQGVSISVPAGVSVDETTPVEQKLPPIREALERLLRLYQAPAKVDPSTPWELQMAPDVGRQATVDDLKAYLDAGVPPQTVTWLLHMPEGADGRFPVSVNTGKGVVGMDVVVGDRFAPGPLMVEGPGGVVKSVKVVFPQAHVEGSFLRVMGMEIGWLWLYVLVYLPLVFLVRWILRVA